MADDFQWVEGGLRFSGSDVLNVSQRVHFYRPVIELYFAGTQSVFPCSARALHVASTTIHLVNVALAMILTRTLGATPMFAGLSGLMLAVQPAPAHAVLWPSA